MHALLPELEHEAVDADDPGCDLVTPAVTPLGDQGVGGLKGRFTNLLTHTQSTKLLLKTTRNPGLGRRGRSRASSTACPQRNAD